MVYFNPTIHSNFKGEWTKKEQLRIDRLFFKICQKVVSLVHRPSDFMSEFTCNCNPSIGGAEF